MIETYNVYGILSIFMRSNNKILTGHYFSYQLFESVSPVGGETKNGDACSNNNNNLYGILSAFLFYFSKHLFERECPVVVKNKNGDAESKKRRRISEEI